MAIDYARFTEGEGASHALVAKLTQELTFEQSAPVQQGDGWAIYRDSEVVDWRDLGPAPYRRKGRTALSEPASFSAYVTRLAVPETTIYADQSTSAFVAVFNDHPATTDAVLAQEAPAGFCDHTARLDLRPHEDWVEWFKFNGKLQGQRDFGEFIETMAHTVIDPSAATMLEVATTLTMKSSLDYGSRVRLDNGDVEFKFVQESTMKAGRANSVEIPSAFSIETPIWEGSGPVTLDARLRVRALGDGVQMGYKLIGISDARRQAFADVVDLVAAGVPGHVPIFHGVR